MFNWISGGVKGETLIVAFADFYDINASQHHRFQAICDVIKRKVWKRLTIGSWESI